MSLQNGYEEQLTPLPPKFSTNTGHSDSCQETFTRNYGQVFEISSLENNNC